MPNIKGGYYIKARCIQESEIQHAPPHVREIWDWFLMKANHAPYKKHGNNFDRGQLLCTYADMQEALHWTIGWRKKAYSKGDCETAMKWLKKRVMVTTRKTTKGMIVTICNYGVYQNPKNYETYKEAGNEPTELLQTDDSINKNEKNVKNEKKSNKKTTLPKDFSISEGVKKWAAEKGHTNLEEHLENFKTASLAKGYTYADWDCAFKNAVRNNWAKLTEESGDDWATPEEIAAEEARRERYEESKRAI